MANMTEISKEMDELETEALTLLADREMSSMERRVAFRRLLARYGVSEAYKAALAAFIRRMLAAGGDTFDPAEVLREILASPEFASLLSAVLATFIAVTYEDGPRSAWVPVVFPPTLTFAVPRL